MLLAALACALGGCGEPVPVGSHGRRLHFLLDEYRVRPQRVVAPAGRLTISARDVGILSHNLRIVRTVKQRDGTRVEQTIAGTKSLQPGQSDTFRVTLKSGTYRIACTLANHENLGQYGELVILRASKPAP